ncbi:helix-turn-helix domain-containing protein [Nocardia salmonicida]|uniref:helix-turn-helix domain-containing protein n=1 Tax=Nocardia salmonicida TaxID=53431 RepID=UPI0033DC7288
MTTRSTHLISMKDAAAVLGCHYDTVKRYVADGTIPHVRIGRMIRIDPAALASMGDDTPPIAEPPTPPVATAPVAELPPPVVRDEWAEYIERVVAAAPPLTPEQVARISTLLGSARGAALAHSS